MERGQGVRCARGSGEERGWGTFCPSGGPRGEREHQDSLGVKTLIISFKVRTKIETFSEENCQLEIDFFGSDEERQVQSSSLGQF